MTKENRAAVVKLLKKIYQDNLQKPLPQKSLLYLKGSFGKARYDDDVNNTLHYEATFSYLVGLNCLYMDSVIDLATNEVYLVDILDKYRENIWVQGVSPEQLQEFGLKEVINKQELAKFVGEKNPEVIFINRGIHRRNKKWSHHWVPDELEEFRHLMNFDLIYPIINLARTVKNPTEIQLMREVNPASS